MKTAILAVSADTDWLRRLERAAGGLGLGFSRARGERALAEEAGGAVAVVDWGPAEAEAGRWARAVRRLLPGCVLAFAVEGGASTAEAASAALAQGADGVLDKDASEPALAARLRELGRRAAAAARGRRLTSPDGGLCFEPARGRVFLRRRGLWRPGPVLSVREAGLLQLLLESPGRVLERMDLLEALWRGRGGDVNSEALDKQAASLRRKLGPSGRGLRTVRGRGYCWG
jgi:DNA-binding response OmpR family regulator